MGGSNEAICTDRASTEVFAEGKCTAIRIDKNSVLEGSVAVEFSRKGWPNSDDDLNGILCWGFLEINNLEVYVAITDNGRSVSVWGVFSL